MDPLLNRVVFYILVVDDDPDDQYLIRKAISEEIPDAIIESLYDGGEALSYLHNCTALPSLIILDLNMLRISGKETLRIIQQNEHLATVPVIVLTTSRNSDERKELLHMGASAFYSKPDTTTRLNAIMKEIRERWLEVFVQR